jgi:hypothetical protein
MSTGCRHPSIGRGVSVPWRFGSPRLACPPCAGKARFRAHSARSRVLEIEIHLSKQLHMTQARRVPDPNRTMSGNLVQN